MATIGRIWIQGTVSTGSILCICVICLSVWSVSGARPSITNAKTPSTPGDVRLCKTDPSNQGEVMTFSISPTPEVLGCPGETISVPILLTDPPEPVDAFVLDLNYPLGLLSYDTVDVSGSLTENWFIVAGSENSPGIVTIGGFNTEGITKSGTLFSILFTVNEGATGQGSFCLSNLGDKLVGANTECGTFSSEDCPTSIEDNGDIFDHPLPTSCRLEQNYPNPFNAATDIRYQIEDGRSPTRTSLKIFNILGQQVRALVDEFQEPGLHTVTWDGRDAFGQKATSGVYYYTLSVNGGQWVETQRMVLMK